MHHVHSHTLPSGVGVARGYATGGSGRGDARASRPAAGSVVRRHHAPHIGPGMAPPVGTLTPEVTWACLTVLRDLSTEVPGTSRIASTIPSTPCMQADGHVLPVDDGRSPAHRSMRR